MDRTLTICYTSDTHGYFSPVDYAAAADAPTGLSNCAANFVRDGNSLILDGGDVLQGSPFSYWLWHRDAYRTESVPAKLMNLAGYQFVTVGELIDGRADTVGGAETGCLSPNEGIKSRNVL